MFRSGNPSRQRNRNSTTLFWLWFASYESDDRMISHHCYIQNIRSLLEKPLETGGFRTMKLQCSFLASRSRDFLASGAELLIIAHLEPVKEQGLEPNSRTGHQSHASAPFSLPHPSLAWQKSWNSPAGTSTSLISVMESLVLYSPWLHENRLLVSDPVGSSRSGSSSPFQGLLPWETK